MFVRPFNIDSALNQLHRTVVDEQVKMHQAQHMEEIPTGEKASKAPIPSSGKGSSGVGRGLGTLKEPT